MFEEYINQLYSTPDKPTEYETLNIGNTVRTPFILEEKLRNISNMPNDELYEILSLGYSTILNKDFIDKNKSMIGNLFMNERFVTIFSQVLMNVTIPFTSEQKTSCNRLIYDYIVYHGDNKNDEVMNVLYKVGKTINRDLVPIMCALGLSEALALDLIIARHSTKNEYLGMQRVNVTIINSDPSIMTEQMIVWIYEKLFDHLTPMFEGIMFDVWDDDDFVNEDKEEVYGLINLAILDILQEAPMVSIISVISSFAQDRYFIHANDPIRFNIKAISVSDNGRVVEAIDHVEKDRGINVPGV